MQDLTYRMAFLVCSVTSSNPRVRRGGGESGRGEGRNAVDISYDDGMCGCMT